MILDERIIRARKIEVLGELATGMAHGFNNLLMSIQGNVSLMMMDVDRSHPFYELLTAIEKSIFEGAKQASRILGFARNSEEVYQHFNLNILIDEISDVFGTISKKAIIDKDFGKKISSIKGNRAQLSLVLIQVFKRAAEAMPSGGIIGIETREVSYKNLEGKYYSPASGNYLRMKITNNGSGYDVNSLDLSAEKPHSQKLSSVQEDGHEWSTAFGIIKGHLGYMGVESDDGKDAFLCIYLPISNEKERQMSIPDEKSSYKNGTMNILLVDDDKTVLEIGGRVLKKLNYCVYNAKDGTEAVETLKQENGSIDMVILDMIIPGTKCETTFTRLKEINPEVKVILSSGYDMNEEAQQMMALGCNGFIQKPFRIKEISQKIDEVMSLN